MNSLSSNKKILITVAAFLLIILVLIGVLKLAGSSGQNNDDEIITETTTYAQSGSVEEISEETSVTHAPAAATIPEMNNNVSDAVASAIVAYMSGQYYIDGVMESDGTQTEMKLAISGKDFYTTAEIEGMTVSIFYKDNKIYFINDDTKQYILLSDVLMDQVDVDLSEMAELTEYLNLTQYNFTGYEQYTSSVGGREADCFKYYNDEMSVVFYFVGDELKQVDMGNSDGVTASTITVNDFSPDIPDGMMSLNGLTKTTLVGFFGESLY